MLKAHHVLRTCGDRVIAVTISADASNVNLRTLAGSPASVAIVAVTINSGVKLETVTTGTGWTAGSKMTIVNNGTIYGPGGNGGNGGASGLGGGGGAGTAGGHALTIADANVAVTLDNTSGYVFGGGGGGGGGANNVGNKGGGGGAGWPDGTSGTATSGGHAGNTTTFGSFAGGTHGAGDGVGADGGDGGGPGGPGSSGQNLTGSGFPASGAGGNPGNAVRHNGYGITISAGNNSAQVKGTVGA